MNPAKSKSAWLALLTAGGLYAWQNRDKIRGWLNTQRDQLNKIVDATAVNTTTVRLKTEGPYPVLLAQLVKLSIVPKRYVESVGDAKFNLEPMGSGPYRLSGWQKGVRIGSLSDGLSDGSGFLSTRGLQRRGVLPVAHGVELEGEKQ